VEGTPRRRGSACGERRHGAGGKVSDVVGWVHNVLQNLVEFVGVDVCPKDSCRELVPVRASMADRVVGTVGSGQFFSSTGSTEEDPWMTMALGA
jgi:hypothetical protein